jgi:hypothetical protein
MEDVGKLKNHLVYFMIFRICYGHLEYFVVFLVYFPVLVCCTKKNLATLTIRSEKNVSSNVDYVIDIFQKMKTGF